MSKGIAALTQRCPLTYSRIADTAHMRVGEAHSFTHSGTVTALKCLSRDGGRYKDGKIRKKNFFEIIFRFEFQIEE